MCSESRIVLFRNARSSIWKQKSLAPEILFKKQVYITCNILGSVFGMNNVTCMDAMVLIALWLVKREKNITLRTFSDVPDNLKMLTISERDNFDNAYKYCMANTVRFFSNGTTVETF